MGKTGGGGRRMWRKGALPLILPGGGVGGPRWEGVWSQTSPGLFQPWSAGTQSPRHCSSQARPQGSGWPGLILYLET